MAGVNGLGEPAAAPASGGILGAQARAQYAALARLRWQMFRNGLRSKLGAFELGARILAYILYSILGIGLGLGVGAAAYLLASEGKWQYLPLLFWPVFLLWQMIPIMLASFQEQFDMGILLRFPVRFGSYFLLWLVFGLVDTSTILGGLCCVGIWFGITIARPELFAWTALGLAVFAAFNILLTRAIFAWIDRWLAQRKTREILGAVFMVAILSLQLLNPALHRKSHPRRTDAQTASSPEDLAMADAQDYRRSRAEFKARYGPWLETADAVQSWLPPGLAAGALGQSAKHQSGQALTSLGALGLYVVFAGGVLAGRLRAEYRGENLGAAPSRKQAQRREGRWFLDGSGPIAAVMEKELRVLLRSLPLLYAVGTPLVLAVVFSAAFLRGGQGGHVFPMAVPIAVVYALLGFSQLIYNNLGAEGPGIQVYFLSPTPIRTVLLAKNLFISVLFLLVALLAGFLASLRLGFPGAPMVAATAAWLLFALPANLAAGNVFSLTMPFRINPGRIAHRRGSQANALLSLLVQLGLIAIGAAVFGIGWFMDELWFAVPVFLALAAGAVFFWMRVLRNADALANGRRDTLIAALMKTE
jgi:ABC-2 type transport system permease protein